MTHGNIADRRGWRNDTCLEYTLSHMSGIWASVAYLWGCVCVLVDRDVCCVCDCLFVCFCACVSICVCVVCIVCMNNRVCSFCIIHFVHSDYLCTTILKHVITLYTEAISKTPPPPFSFVSLHRVAGHWRNSPGANRPIKKQVYLLQVEPIIQE